MPSYSLKAVGARAVVRIAEVNPRRETLTIVNHNSSILVIADDDAPLIARNAIHGIPLQPYTSVTLERESGDEPDKAWYLYNSNPTYGLAFVVFEGVTPKRRERWW